MIQNLDQKVDALIRANQYALHDKHSVAFAVECHPKNAEKRLALMHELGDLIIDHWIRKPGNPVPVYRTKLRPGPDAPKPDALPADVKRAARRTRPEVRETEARVKRNERKGLPKHQLPTPRLGMFGI